MKTGGGETPLVGSSPTASRSSGAEESPAGAAGGLGVGAVAGLTVISGDPGEKLRKMEGVICQHGIELSYEIIPGGALGQSREGSIAVRPGLTSAETFAVLVHELAHELLHKGERRKETTKTVRGTEAEAVAFVVCRAAGLERGSRSSDYIQLYAGDKEVLLESLEHIQKTASLIISELDSEAGTEEVGPSLQSDQGQTAHGPWP